MIVSNVYSSIGFVESLNRPMVLNKEVLMIYSKLYLLLVKTIYDVYKGILACQIMVMWYAKILIVKIFFLNLKFNYDCVPCQLMDNIRIGIKWVQ
jgi:hypothetical protein